VLAALLELAAVAAAALIAALVLRPLEVSAERLTAPAERTALAGHHPPLDPAS
jgi:hypothetical protein